jgi:hypothetical protein
VLVSLAEDDGVFDAAMVLVTVKDRGGVLDIVELPVGVLVPPTLRE